jgi:hypothetical protein
MYPSSKDGRIWYSESLDEVYSEFQTSVNTHNKNDAFLDLKKSWHEGRQGIPRINAQSTGYDEGNNFYWGNYPVNYDEEHFISENPEYLKYAGKNILILGGGPTASESEWENLNVDYIWTMNHFFLNDKIVYNKPSLISLGNEVDFSYNNKKLHSFINTHDCDIVIQPNDVRKNVNSFILEFNTRIGYFSPRWNGKLGASQRMILLAIFLKANHIYIAGVDGITRNFNRDLGERGLHSFQRDVHFKEGYGYDIMVIQNVIFWQYVMDLKNLYDFKLTNLGEGHPSNMASEITKLFF